MDAVRRPAPAEERYRTLLEINNALVSNLTREALFGAIAGPPSTSLTPRRG